MQPAKYIQMDKLSFSLPKEAKKIIVENAGNSKELKAKNKKDQRTINDIESIIKDPSLKKQTISELRENISTRNMWIKQYADQTTYILKEYNRYKKLHKLATAYCEYVPRPGVESPRCDKIFVNLIASKEFIKDQPVILELVSQMETKYTKYLNKY